MAAPLIYFMFQASQAICETDYVSCVAQNLMITVQTGHWHSVDLTMESSKDNDLYVGSDLTLSLCC